MVDRDRGKRPSSDVLFKWDPRSNSMNFDSVSVPDDVFIKRRQTEAKAVDKAHEFLDTLDENESAELDKLFKDSTTDGLNLNPDLLSKNRDKRAELMKNLKKFQLHSCKDWLGANTHKSSIDKVDTLDRLSSVVINPEFPMKHEAVLYSMQLGKSDLEFYNALVLTKLSRMSNPSVIELIRQPVFVRNRMLILTDRKKCDCPLNVLTKQQPPQKGFLQPRSPFVQSQPQPSPQQFPVQQGTFGDSLLNRFMMPHGSIMTPSLFGPEKNYSNLFGLDKRFDQDKRHDYVDEKDIVCPFHFAKDLPEPLKSPKALCGVITHYNMFYKYEDVRVSNKNFHVLSLFNLESNNSKYPLNKVYQYKLPSKLLAVNHVYLRDFEYERYYSNNNLYNSGNYMTTSSSTGNTFHLANLYSGDALFLVTKSEFMIVLVNLNNYSSNSKTPSLRLGVLLRDKNYGHNVKEVLCHKQSGRIFMLESNSLLYEYQYQFGFGPKSLREYKFFNYLYNTLEYTKYLVLNMVRRNKVYELTANHKPKSNYEETTNTTYVEGSADNLKDYWTVNNCLDTMESTVSKSTCYYPPLLWNELQFSTATATNLFTSGPSGSGTLGPGLTSGTTFTGFNGRELCKCGFGCLLNRVQRTLKCLNPWNKTFMKSADSVAVLDQDRWTLSLLNTTSGDLSVFYIHGYSTLDDYLKATTTNERVFPYDLTLYNLKHGTMMNTLDRMGYGRFSYNSKFVKLLTPPLDFVQGVDLVLVDNYGVKIFLGFSNMSLTTSTSLISTSLTSNLTANLGGDSMNISASNGKPTLAPTKVGLSVKGFRLPVRYMGQQNRGPFSLFRSKTNVTSFHLDDLFLTMEPVRKVQNGTLVRMIVTKNDSSSFFQNYATLPLSLNEEFYAFNENTVQYKTLEENQPLEYYHEFYIKLTEKEKVITVFQSETPGSVTLDPSLESNTDNDTNSNGLVGSSLESSRNLENKLVMLVTTEKVYKFNKLNVDLILKSLVKYPKNTLMLIKPPPLLNGNTPSGTNPSTGRDLSVPTSMTTLSTHNSNVLQVQNKDLEEENSVFNLKNYLNGTNTGGNYFLSSIEQSNNQPNPLNLNQGQLVSTNSYLSFPPHRTDNTNYYLNYLNYRNDRREELFSNIFGDDLVEICENSKELIGYSLYYLSWLYGPENMFKFVLNYLTQLLTTCSYGNGNDSLNYYGSAFNVLTNYYTPTSTEVTLNSLNNDLLYNYIFTNNMDDYNVFIGSFGIPYKIFNYVVPGCYCVLEQTFEKPVVSPWCKFVSFSHNNNKIKQNRVTTNTSPLVDGLLLLVSELLSPMYYNRVFNLVPQLYTNTVTNPTSSTNSTNPHSLGFNNMYTSYYNPNSSRLESRYLMDNLTVNRYDNMNEFVIGTRVDMYLSMDLSMGLEEARKLLEQLYSLHLIVFELVKSYQKCNLENVVHIMSTLAPNVVKMLLSPNSNQYEPYPTGSQTQYFYSEPPLTTTDVYSYYNGDPNPSNKTTNPSSLNSDMLLRLESLIKDRYVNDLRTLKELTTILQVSQEFLASSVLLHNSTVLGDYNYDFDKNLHLLQLLPSKTPRSFFSPVDFSLGLKSEGKFLSPFGVKFSHDSPKSKLVLTKTMVQLMAQANLINLFMNKELFRLFRTVVWLTGGNVSTLQKHFFGHLFTPEEIGLMNNCNRIKFLQRQYENTDDVARAEYLQSLTKQFSVN